MPSYKITSRVTRYEEYAVNAANITEATKFHAVEGEIVTVELVEGSAEVTPIERPKSKRAKPDREAAHDRQTLRKTEPRYEQPTLVMQGDPLPVPPPLPPLEPVPAGE